MTFVIEIGWWLIPLAISILAFLWAVVATPRSNPGYYGYGSAIAGLFTYVPALIVSLIAWLIWAVLT